MTTMQRKLPGPDHPITIAPNPARVVVSVAGRVIAETREALTLREASYPAVLYIPRKDVDMALLERTDRATYCPYKGKCAYYSIPLGGKRSVNAVWTYEDPFAAVAEIRPSRLLSRSRRGDRGTVCGLTAVHGKMSVRGRRRRFSPAVIVRLGRTA